MRDSAAYYNLDLVPKEGGMKEALADFLASEAGSKTQAILVGTRRTDPHGGKQNVTEFYCRYGVDAGVWYILSRSQSLGSRSYR